MKWLWLACTLIMAGVVYAGCWIADPVIAVGGFLCFLVGLFVTCSLWED